MTVNGRSLNGWFATDSIGMEDQDSDLDDELKVTSHFFLIRRIDDDRENLASSDTINGIIGLGPGKYYNHTSYIQLLYEKNITSSPVFSLLLCDDSGEGTSSITLGGQNQAYIKNGTTIPPPINSNLTANNGTDPLWGFYVTDLKFNESHLLQKGNAVINSTLSGMLLDKESYATFKNVVTSANVTISCDMQSKCGTQQYSCE